ncbi:rhomboid domain-containing protein 3 [Spea bombifrons]|uniref:rhomboid domain-containing protein 3 n=1 Tax=Spea bombifrons TaxID=233779 RepID=UPI00234BFA76|nr:rhomboid domain-containing protein 3 [Spea bombifrons]
MEMLKGLLLARVPPLGCCFLLTVMTCGGLLSNCKQLGLHLETLREVWDGHRLLTHVLCAPDIILLLISLLLLLIICGELEEHLGTLYYLQLSCLYTVGCAALYLLFSWLLPSSIAPASGYVGSQLAILTAERPTLQRRLGRRMMMLLPWCVLVTIFILCPQSSLLLHVCGVIAGLVFRSASLSCLQKSESWRVTLDRIQIFQSLALLPLARFIPSRNKGSVNPDREEERAEERDVHQSVLLTDEQLAEVFIPDALLARFTESPVSIPFGDPEALENEMLKAGIQASLREYKQQERIKEPTLHKSSVSALRLQQLEQMGFPTGPAVVALAATGKVDRAVSLLVEGQVGEDINVTSER